jgi:hypothetical protein
MTTFGPGPNDTVIGFRIGCDRNQPGLDGTWDRVVRISYRPGRLGPLPRNVNPQPPDGDRGAFPQNPDLTKPVSGVETTPDGTVWIDCVVYGAPSPGALGDDSGDMAGRISEAVDNGIIGGKINPTDIQVEHNDLSDVQEGNAATDSRGKTIDRHSDKRGDNGGRGRIIIRGGASHVDASSNDGKIELVIITPTNSGTVKLDDTLPPRVPPTRGPATGGSQGEGWGSSTGGTGHGSGPQKPTQRQRKKKPKDEGPPSRAYLRDDIPWYKPAKPRAIAGAPRSGRDTLSTVTAMTIEYSTGLWVKTVDLAGRFSSKQVASALEKIGLVVSSYDNRSVAFRAMSRPGLADVRFAVGWSGSSRLHIAWEAGERTNPLEPQPFVSAFPADDEVGDITEPTAAPSGTTFVQKVVQEDNARGLGAPAVGGMQW